MNKSLTALTTIRYLNNYKCSLFFFNGAGQSTKACELFLKNRAAAVQTAIRQLRIEGATLLYIHKLCNIFFTSLLETAKEFEMDFAGNTGCYSAFVVWSRSAIGMFVDAFSKQVAVFVQPLRFIQLPLTLMALTVKNSLP